MFNFKMHQLWLLPRFSALFILALLPSIIYSAIEWTKLDFKSLPYWFNFGKATIFGLFISAIFIHSFLGIEIIIQDYIPENWKKSILFLSKWGHLALILMTWLLLIILAFKGA